jgi:hypothetical protein
MNEFDFPGAEFEIILRFMSSASTLTCSWHPRATGIKMCHNPAISLKRLGNF